MELVAILLAAVFIVLVAQLLKGKGNSSGRSGAPSGRSTSSDDRPNRILNNYKTLAEVETALRKAGLESSDLIIAVDFTKSNSWQGERSFNNQSLHALHGDILTPYNPYQQVIATLSDVLLKRLDDDCSVPMYGFGDVHTQNRKVFMLNNERPCGSKEELLCAYADAAAAVTLSGPTSFAPAIGEAVDMCRSTGKYFVLILIADGLMDDVQETIDAIVAASHHPLSIIMVGVGDGPWDSMETFDDSIPDRAFDNFQFVNFTALTRRYPQGQERERAMAFALEALMELPEQYQTIKRDGLLRARSGSSLKAGVRFAHRLTGKHRFPTSFRPDMVAAASLSLSPSAPEGCVAPGGAHPPPYAPHH